jgi:hypothetical protein
VSSRDYRRILGLYRGAFEDFAERALVLHCTVTVVAVVTLIALVPTHWPWHAQFLLVCLPGVYVLVATRPNGLARRFEHRHAIHDFVYRQEGS